MKSIADYRAGKQNALQFLMGQVMKETKGKANPQIIVDILKKRLG
jgi:aspartyl-tRNA(Asn)/glutamyl-tRNA(Gln) amidotransferase subunit B